MFKWLRRLLVWGLLIFAVVWVVSRLLNREEDFDDYDDIDMGLEFTETPVEIDVPASEHSDAATATPLAPAMAQTAPEAVEAGGVATAEEQAQPESAEAQRGSLIDINGIGPTYAA